MSYRCRLSRRECHVPIAVVLLLACTGMLRAQGPAAGPDTPVTAAAAQNVAAQPPLPNRFNSLLPSWLRVRGEFRERMEAADNSGFTTGRDDLYWLSRFRFDAAVSPSRLFSFQLQVQDARVARKDLGSAGAPFKAALDLRMAFAEVGSANGPAIVRVGRQELAFGEQRLVGHVSWANAARTFDAARVTLRHPRVQLDLFAASVVRILPETWDRSGRGSRFHGAYASTSALVPKSTVQPYFFWRGDRALPTETGGAGDLRQTTTGVRAVGQLPAGFDYGMEMAAQGGSLGPDSVGAWAGHFQIRTPAFGRGLRLVSEYNYGSGDGDPTDGRRGTFDQMYPTPHDKYGLADQVGWRNIHHVRAGLEIAGAWGLPVRANYHTWWLASARDALYLASGAQLARIASGALHRHVGHELDVQVSRELTPQLQLVGGYAYLRPGGFLKEATPGASYSSPFVMLTYVFLAEK